MLFLAMITFWPTYVSLPPSANSPYTHIHAALATLWVLLLIAQPMLIRSGRRSLHRLLGKVSLVLAPLFLIAVVLLAHDRIKGLEGMAYNVQVYILWLQVSLGTLFAISWVMGMITRRNMAQHARFMICTGLTMIDPVVVRLLIWMGPQTDLSFQWFTFWIVH